MAGGETESGKNRRRVGEKRGEQVNREEEETNLSRGLGNATVRMGWCRWWGNCAGGDGGARVAAVAQGRQWRC